MNVTRYFPMSAINFAVKERIARYLVPEICKGNEKKVLLAQILSGGLSGCLASFCVYPLDLARTKMSADVMNSSIKGRRYAGLRDAL